jgi:hypothetical protein
VGSVASAVIAEVYDANRSGEVAAPEDCVRAFTAAQFGKSGPTNSAHRATRIAATTRTTTIKTR